jgi:predicted phage terminase large subunit-like protein
MPTYRANWHHVLIANYLERVQLGEISRLLIFAPPRHGKSQLASRHFPAWCLGKNPDEQILAWSYNDPTAQDFNRDTQRIMLSDAYTEVFPNTQLNTRNVFTRAADKARRNARIFDVVGTRGYYQGAGTGGPFTGHGGTLIIVDDPVKNYEEAFSKTHRERVWNFWRSTLRTRSEGAFAIGGDVRIVGLLTRWHEDDWAGRIIQDAKAGQGGEQWHVISLPAILDADPMPGDPREQGEALWPEKYDLGQLTQLRRSVGAQSWEALYQQRPSPPEGGMFKRHWWRRYDQPPERFDIVTQSWDMTFRDTTSGSFVVGQVWGAKGPKHYLLDQIRERLDFVTTLERFRALSKRWPNAIAKLVEDKANGPAVISALSNEIGGIISITPRGGKEARAASCTPIVEAGNVYLPLRADWGVDEFIEEHAAFPSGAHDDQVDATSQYLNHSNASVVAAMERLVQW